MESQGHTSTETILQLVDAVGISKLFDFLLGLWVLDSGQCISSWLRLYVVRYQQPWNILDPNLAIFESGLTAVPNSDIINPLAIGWRQ